ncbi:MAG: cytochrome c3 family protein [Candidatus Sulfobium sp.]|jgi:c(7)-type cytochrome triheme protein
MTRILSILVMVVMLSSCKAGTQAGEKKAEPREKAPVITSLKDSGLPCFSCHSYEKFAADKPGQFSHVKHIGFGVHCNQCHIIMAHEKIELNKDTCNNCHNLKKDLTYPSAGMKPAVFSHSVHTAMFACGSCHTGIFKYRKGGSGIRMDDIYKGKFCGKCHNGQTAFPSTDCQKCHK